MKMYGYGFAREAAVHGNTESPHPHLSHTNPLTLHSGSKPATCVQGRRGEIKSKVMISGSVDGKDPALYLFATRRGWKATRSPVPHREGTGE